MWDGKGSRLSTLVSQSIWLLCTIGRLLLPGCSTLCNTVRPLDADTILNRLKIAPSYSIGGLAGISTFLVAYMVRKQAWSTAESDADPPSLFSFVAVILKAIQAAFVNGDGQDGWTAM